MVSVLLRSARRRGHVLAAAALAAAALVVACVGEDVTATDATTPDAAPSSPSSSDAGPAVDGGDGGGPELDASPSQDAGTRFCATQSPELGVADFFCADFDGPDVKQGFTDPLVPDGGALSAATDLFFSPPASLSTSGNATLTWTKAGPSRFSQLDLEFRLFVGELGGVAAPSTTPVSVAQIASLDTQISLVFTRGGVVEGGAYVGYYVRASWCPGPCALIERKVPSPPTNAWTRVRLVWNKAGDVNLTYNGVDALTVTAVTPSDSVKVSARVGLEVEGADAPLMTRHLFDDVLVRVKREAL